MGTSHKKRNSWTPNDQDIEEIAVMAARGCTMKSIAGLFNIHPDTFRIRIDEYPALAEAIEGARAHGESVASGHLWTIVNNPAHKSHFNAVCFYLKTQHRWKESRDSDETIPTNTFVGYDIVIVPKRVFVEPIAETQH